MSPGPVHPGAEDKYLNSHECAQCCSREQTAVEWNSSFGPCVGTKKPFSEAVCFLSLTLECVAVSCLNENGGVAGGEQRTDEGGSGQGAQLLCFGSLVCKMRIGQLPHSVVVNIETVFQVIVF